MVKTVICRFCSVFGREDALKPLDRTKKPRKRTVKPKFFTSFHIDLCEKYLNSQHTQKWKPYNEVILDDDKEAFFDLRSVPNIESSKAAFEGESSMFAPCDDKYKGWYQVTKANASRFRLCVRFLDHGAPFLMAAALMDDTKEETGIGQFQGCIELVAAPLECLAHMMYLHGLSPLRSTVLRIKENPTLISMPDFLPLGSSTTTT
ncbi:hypothetical protein BBJ28_00021091 [Nothophytophthora sp. Chile5]|nr:hypothetical protein BBJ28_00021091 [Nothophytophthora sp. Chile5]